MRGLLKRSGRALRCVPNAGLCSQGSLSSPADTVLSKCCLHGFYPVPVPALVSGALGPAVLYAV